MRDRRFAILWACVAAAYLAQWMLPVTAQWFLLSRPRGESLVPLVQVALTLPMALLAIPAGVVADRVDRRRLVVAVQVVVLIVEAGLVVLALTGGLAPWSLLALLAVLACGIVATFTSLSSMVPDLVRIESIPAASALLTIATNATRVIGPALAGFMLALSSVGVAFAAAIPATVLLLVVLTRMPTPTSFDQAHDRWLHAARDGIQFVRHSPQALKLMLRSFCFTAGIMGLLSLLPLLATRLGASSGELGTILAMQGVGAVLGALTLSHLSRVALPNRIVAVGFTAATAASGLAAEATSLLVLTVSVILAGWAWTTVLATVQAGMQQYLPGWVRARGLSLLLVATFAGQALGAWVLGWVGNTVSLTWTLIAAAVVLFAGAVLAIVLPLKDLHHLDRSAVRGWSTPELVVAAAEEDTRQLQVRVRYEVPPDNQPEFFQTMASLRRIRLRTGARRWQLLEDSEMPGVFYEEFTVGSWSEHEQQVEARAVASDRSIEMRARALATTSEPSIHYFLKVNVTRFDRNHARPRTAPGTPHGQDVRNGRARPRGGSRASS